MSFCLQKFSAADLVKLEHPSLQLTRYSRPPNLEQQLTIHDQSRQMQVYRPIVGVVSSRSTTSGASDTVIAADVIGGRSEQVGEAAEEVKLCRR